MDDREYHPPPVEIRVNARNRRDEGDAADGASATRGDYNMQIFQDPRRRHAGYYFQQLLLEIYRSHRTAVLVVANALAIIAVTVVFGRLLRARCGGEEESGEAPAGAQVYCSRFVQTDRVVVDIDLNTTAHCHSSQSCAALAASLRESQGRMRYNFILGGWGFVYVGAGFRCRTEETENALYIRLPVDSIFGGRDFVAARRAVAKLNELLREGLECSRVLHNFTVATTGCGRHDRWCERVLRETVTEEVPDRGETAARSVYKDRTRPAAFFDLFDLSRVYNFRYRLVECTKNPGTKR